MRNNIGTTTEASKIRKILLSVSAMSMLASFVSAEVGFDNGKDFNIRKEISKVEVPAPVALQVLPEWTIMVFMNGKNDLEKFALKDMNEMEQVGSTARMNIVVEVGRGSPFEPPDGDWKGTRRYLMEKDGDTGKISSKVLEDLGKVDMGDYKNLAAFGKWAKSAYPAKKYMLIVWSHGTGWDKGLKAGISKGISYDDATLHHINTPQLGLALKEIGRLDIYGSDACLMQMAEVAYEIKDSVDYIVGSEETEPDDGYTYDTFLGLLAAKPDMAPDELARAAVESYGDHYQATGEGSTLSYIKSASLPGLLNAVNAFSDAIIRGGDKYDLNRTFSVYPKNKDLYYLAQLVAEGTRSADVKAKSKALMDYITGMVQDNRTTGKYSNSHGMAIYVPPMPPESGYTDLAWAKDSQWAGFIDWYMKK